LYKEFILKIIAIKTNKKKKTAVKISPARQKINKYQAIIDANYRVGQEIYILDTNLSNKVYPDYRFSDDYDDDENFCCDNSKNYEFCKCTCEECHTVIDYKYVPKIVKATIKTLPKVVTQYKQDYGAVVTVSLGNNKTSDFRVNLLLAWTKIYKNLEDAKFKRLSYLRNLVNIYTEAIVQLNSEIKEINPVIENTSLDDVRAKIDSLSRKK